MSGDKKHVWDGGTLIGMGAHYICRYCKTAYDKSKKDEVCPSR